MRENLLVFVLVFITISALSACMYGSAAMTGAQAIYDRHALQKKIDDNYTTMRAYRAIYVDSHQFANTNVSVISFDNSILMIGQVPDPAEKIVLVDIIRKIGEGRKIYDYIELANPSSALTRASDSWITAKIKAQFIAINEMEPSKIKVITENGTVFLIGTVPRDQAEIAIEVAQSTAGVQNMVKIFSYLHVSET